MTREQKLNIFVKIVEFITICGVAALFTWGWC